MKAQSYVAMVLAMAALLVVLGIQGCLFGGGGGGGEQGGEGATTPEGGAPAAGAPEGGAPEGGPPAGEAPGGGMMGGAPAGEAPAGGAPAGEAPAAPGGDMGAPAAGGAAQALEAKHAGNWAGARAQLEQALATNPDDPEANRILAWILADTDAQAAIEHFNKFLQSGAGTDQQKADAKAAVERLQAR